MVVVMISSESARPAAGCEEVGEPEAGQGSPRWLRGSGPEGWVA